MDVFLGSNFVSRPRTLKPKNLKNLKNLKKPKNLKTYKNFFKNLGFFQPCGRRKTRNPHAIASIKPRDAAQPQSVRRS